MKMLNSKKGFTLIELMIVVAIIGILAAIAIPQFANLVAKSQEGATKGNLGTVRSALSIYYGDTEGFYPTDALVSLTTGGKYLQNIPNANLPKTNNNSGHGNNGTVNVGTFADNGGGGWWYNNNGSSNTWGTILVQCSHSDTKGALWSSY